MGFCNLKLKHLFFISSESDKQFQTSLYKSSPLFYFSDLRPTI